MGNKKTAIELETDLSHAIRAAAEGGIPQRRAQSLMAQEYNAVQEERDRQRQHED